MVDDQLEATKQERSAEEQLSRATAGVDLVGSAKVRVATYKLRDAHSDVHFASSEIFVRNSQWILDPANKRQALDVAIKAYDEKRLAASRARIGLIEAAREDLGISFGKPGSVFAEYQIPYWVIMVTCVAAIFGMILGRGGWKFAGVITAAELSAAYQLWLGNTQSALIMAALGLVVAIVARRPRAARR
ncbi:hypothetical protein [Mycobacterium sp. TY815]|uniref:hypothetical protein n=1 Tax=Mycobacterium sp. TY815 TaxID=3050581 RepID=UPI00274138FD|nr:hypothetical protein [Mycobacterium sp. TY815]MDP7703360.1 hypothetical protein [Mycobacterium sp. TY815]